MDMVENSGAVEIAREESPCGYVDVCACTFKEEKIAKPW